MTLQHTAGDSGALFEMSGTISNNATWDEYIYFWEDGAAVDLTGLSFELQFRKCQENTLSSDGSVLSTSLIMSTAGGELVLTADANSITSIVRINVPYTTINGLCGDYITDLVAKDANAKLIHYANGVVTFRKNPVAF